MSKVKKGSENLVEKDTFLTADTLAYFVGLFGAVMLPLIMLPGLSVPLSNTKVFWVILVTLVIAILWLIGRLQTGMLSVSKNLSLVAGGLVVLSLFISSLLSGNFMHAFFGGGFESVSFVTILALFCLLFFSSVIFDRKERVLNFYILLFISGILVGLYTFFIFLLGVFSDLTLPTLPINLVGTWYGFGIFSGFIALSSLIILELFPIHSGKWFRRLLVGTFGFSLLILAFVNFYPTWMIFGLSSLLIFVYVITIGATDVTEDKEEKKSKKIAKIWRPSFVALLISLLFIILGSNGLMSVWLDNLYANLNFSFVDVRPSLMATADVTKGALKEDVLFGVGPNNFDEVWARYKPDSVNELPYWDLNFATGIGLLPSFIATSGLIGVLAWVFFLCSFFFFGFKGIFDKNLNTFSRLIIFLLFVGALYLWIFALIYPVSTTLFALAFIVSGLLIAQLTAAGVTKSITLSLTEDPRINFGSVLGIVIIIMIAVAGSYVMVQKYWALGTYYRIASDNSLSDSDREVLVKRAIWLDSNNDLYYRTLADLKRAEIYNLLQSEGIKEEELKQRFQEVLIEAINSSQQAISINELSYENWLTRGLIYEMIVPLNVSGADEQALSAYNKAVELNPKNPALKLNLARLALANNENTKARNYLNEALEMKGNYTTALFVLAQLDLKEGKNADAISKAQQAVFLSPNSAGSHFQFGYLKYEIGDYDGAIESLETAVSLSPNQVNANAQYFLGLSYEKLGRTRDAIAQFEIIQNYNKDNQEIIQILQNLRRGLPAISSKETKDTVEDIELEPSVGDDLEE